MNLIWGAVNGPGRLLGALPRTPLGKTELATAGPIPWRSQTDNGPSRSQCETLRLRAPIEDTQAMR